jgi:hypothetical protein
MSDTLSDADKVSAVLLDARCQNEWFTAGRQLKSPSADPQQAPRKAWKPIPILTECSSPRDSFYPAFYTFTAQSFSSTDLRRSAATDQYQQRTALTNFFASAGVARIRRQAN